MSAAGKNTSIVGTGSESPAGDGWLAHLAGDPREWLLEPDTPAVRAATHRQLFDRGPQDPEFFEARCAAMAVDPIRAMLAAQSPQGWWVKPGPGYSHSRDPRLAGALRWLVSLQGRDGRWVNRYAYNGKTTVDIDKQGRPSKWVTLRACTVLKAAYSNHEEDS